MSVFFQITGYFSFLLCILYFFVFKVRHADVSADAMVVFLGLGVALGLEIISIYYSSRTFWLIFCFVSLIKYQPFSFQYS